jgi:hypothetical protein
MHDEDHVDTPLPGDRGAHGPFGARSRSFSSNTWLRARVGWISAAACLGLGAFLWRLRKS